jgi:peptidoglycan/LPS O-acetylase OafA/YrhL
LVLFSVVLATLTYACVENPIRRSADLRRSHLRTAAVAVALIAAPLVVAQGMAALSPSGAKTRQYEPRLGAPDAGP